MTITYPKPDILQEIPAHGHVIIEASAGTGKTFTLEHLIVDLLLRHPEVELENVLIVTFTERATAELKVRVRGLLMQLMSAARRDATSEGEGPSWTIDDNARRKLERALFNFDAAPIYTIHGFCQRVLTEYAFAHQRLFDQEHVEFGPLFEGAFTDAMRRTLSCRADTRDWLESWLEVGSVDDLRDLLSRVIQSQAELWPRFRSDVLEEHLPVIGARFYDIYKTLYKRSAKAREQAFRSASEDWAHNASVARFLMLADDEIPAFKYSLKDAVAEDDDQRRLLEVASALIRFKPAIAQKFAPVMQEALNRAKAEQNAYTYDDMLSLVWRSLSRPGADWLVQTLRRRYKFALIDEFQDTDEVQWNIFKKLFFDSNGSNLMFAIGDPKQAIYGFRGADVYTYLDACAAILDPKHVAADEGALFEQEGQVGPAAPLHNVKLHLEHNYRSTEALIGAYNTILDQDAEAPLFSSALIQYTHPVRCGDPTRRAVDAAGEPVVPIVLGEMAPEVQGRVRVDDLYACYGQWIAAEIKRLLDPEGGLFFGPEGAEQRVKASDIFILTRSRGDEVRLEGHLRDAGVPFTVFKQEGLFQTQEAMEVFHLLRAIESPRDRARRLKAWETPFFGVPLDELVHCRDLGEAHPLYKTLLDWHQLARHKKFEELFTNIVRQSGLVRRELFFKDGERELTNYMHVLEVLQEELYRGRLDLGELVMRVKAFVDGKRKPLGENGNVKRVDVDEDAVQVMTMHKSKGLEASVVFLYGFGGMAGEFWPFHYERRDEAGERHVRALHILKPDQKLRPRLYARVEEEERTEAERLLYVALTRAKAQLYLPYVPYVGGAPICSALARRSYNTLNERLRVIAEEVRDGEHEGLFELVTLPYSGSNTQREQTSAEALHVLSRWRPTSPLIDPEVQRRAFAPLREKVLRLESYSSLKKRSGGYTLSPPDDEDLRADDEVGTPQDAVGPDDLPGGVRTGQFLHHILEHLNYETLTRHRDVEDWAADVEVSVLFDRALVEYGIEPQYRALSQRIIYRALSAAIMMDEGVIYGLGLCMPNLRELEFMYPIPEDHHPHLDQQRPDDSAVEVHRGYIKGYIDYVLEWQGKVFFVDWKSDILERYDRATLRAHFEANYTQQAKLYAVALARVMGITTREAYDARFGGAIYCFLRGVHDHGDQGVTIHRPSWDDLLELEGQLLSPDLGASLEAS